MSKIKITEHPELSSLCKQYIDGDREDKQIIWMELSDLCLEKGLNNHLFFEEYWNEGRYRQCERPASRRSGLLATRKGRGTR